MVQPHRDNDGPAHRPGGPRPAGTGLAAVWSQATARATAARQKADPERFIDVSYRDLVADPAGTAAQVLARLGMDHRPHVPARDRRTPDHLYTLERYGLDSASVHRAFADYLAATGNAAD
ncbi:sulfotransferase [Streptomyces sp. NPDC026589]|uniref:sulfotransferase n=1 Tax=Streptomyces sp. NPDC026589 TaxID=3155609 RepID=UPI0033FC4CE5